MIGRRDTSLHGSHDIWRIEERAFVDGYTAIGPLTVHAFRIDLSPTRVVALEMVQTSRTRQDWTLEVVLTSGVPLGSAWTWMDGRRRFHLDRRPYLVVVRGVSATWSPAEPRHDFVREAAPGDAGTWYLCLRNLSGSPEGNVYWIRVVDDVP